MTGHRPVFHRGGTLPYRDRIGNLTQSFVFQVVLFSASDRPRAAQGLLQLFFLRPRGPE